MSELQAAEAQIAAARELRAARYAPAYLDAAESQLQSARAAVEAKDYPLAAQQIELASVEAELAAAKAREAQAQERMQSKLEDNARLQRQLGNGGGR